MAGISATAGAALSGVMLPDGYERDFYVDPADGVNALGDAMGEAMGVFAGELAAAL